MAEIHGNRLLIKRILVPTDGSEGALEAAEFAVDLARSYATHVTLLHVIDEPRIPTALARIPDTVMARVHQEFLELGKAILTLTQAPFAKAGIPVDFELREGSPVHEIANVASEGDYDLIVIGSRGTGRSSSWLLGNVPQQVVRTAPCPVLVVRPRIRQTKEVPTDPT